jgi:hypothetical protein
LKEIEKCNLLLLCNAFKMIPPKTDSDAHKSIAIAIISAFAEKLALDCRKNRIDYTVKHDFLEIYTRFVLNLPKDEIKCYLKPFFDHFHKSETLTDLFQAFVLAEDSLNSYDNFWFVWQYFKVKAFEICKVGDGYSHISQIVKSYLFAQVSWKKTAKEWHTLKAQNKRFFKEISQNIGHCPSTLYAISKLLNGIGSHYIDDGITWISSMLANNKELANEKLEINTIYHVENIVRKYIFENREKIKKTKAIKDNLLFILGFLIERGSVVGYMLRETVV